MLGAVQLGLLAACILVFVPMGMAGWHFTRNKILYFTCALFITLSVAVHMMPYFPVIISSFLSPSEPQISSYRDSCVFFLHNVMYRDDISGKNKSWDWIRTGRVAECEFQKLKQPDASDLLNGSWVVIAGDSQARLMAVSLLDLLMGQESVERIRRDLFKRHSDYSMMVEEIGMKLDFIWAPYVGNLTELLKRNKKNLPDVMVMGAGLWDMLHINNASEYGASLRMLRNKLLSLLPVSYNSLDSGLSESKSLHFFWVGMPTLITSMLNTDVKRERMTGLMCDLYDDELRRSQLLRRKSGGGPLLNLDIRLLSDSCGSQCSVDGMHYDGVVYDAAVQIMLNALLIESDQKP